MRTSALGHQKVSPYSKPGPSEQTPWSQFDCTLLISYIFSILSLLPSGYIQAWATLTPSCSYPGLDHPHLSSLPVPTEPRLHSLRSSITCNCKDHGSPLLRTPQSFPLRFRMKSPLLTVAQPHPSASDVTPHALLLVYSMPTIFVSSFLERP